MQPSKPSFRPPSTVEALERIEAKLDRLDRTLGPLATLAEAPALVSTAVDTFDDIVGGQEAQLDARLCGAVELVERISRPETLATLQRAVDMLETLPALVDSGGMDIEQLAGEGLGLVSQLLVSLRHAQARGDRRLGLLGVLKALRDPSTQRAVGVLMSALQDFGRTLDSQPKPLPA